MAWRNANAVDENDKKVRDEHKEAYLWYKEHGICTQCHSADAVSGKIYCEACAKKHMIYLREYRRQLAARHLCTKCGKRLTEQEIESGRRRCEACREKDRKDKERRKSRNKK